MPKRDLTSVPVPRATTPQPVSLGQPSIAPLPANLAASQQNIAAPQKKSKAPLFALVAVVLLAAGAGALFLTRTPPPAPPQPAPAPPVKPAPPVETRKAEPRLHEVVVATVPPGARVLRDGNLVVETPDVLRVPEGETWSVVLHKDGYVDQPVTIDPARDHKLLVKLEKEQHASAKSHTPQKPPPKVVVMAEPPKPPPPKPAPPPPKPAAPSDSIAAAVEHLAPSGAHRMGGFYSGHANDEGEHNDWFVVLEPGHCYDFVTTGGPGVKEIYAYLWGPNGKRVTDRQEGSPGVTLHYCAATPGSYHFQAKVADGNGDFKMGLYQR
jgi:hypothetical protein